MKNVMRFHSDYVLIFRVRKPEVITDYRAPFRDTYIETQLDQLRFLLNARYCLNSPNTPAIKSKLAIFTKTMSAS